MQPTPRISTPSQTRALLNTAGQKPRHQLGQNFLVDANIVHKAITLAQLNAGQRVVEIGPGLGGLTEVMLAAGATVYAAELDKKLTAHLQNTQPFKAALAEQTLHLLNADAVAHPLAGYTEDAPFKIIANLPYAISTPWLEAVLAQPTLPQCMVLMLQKEAAQRVSAPVGTPAYSPISVWLGEAFTLKTTHAVPASCFYPAPGVGSALVLWVQKPGAFQFSAATKQCMRQLFGQRRKQLGALCKKHALAPALLQWLGAIEAENLGTPKSRPGDIAPAGWRILEAALNAHE